MQYTIRGVPPVLDGRLREIAQQRGESLNAVALELLLRGAGLSGAVVQRDLSDIAGTWVADPEVDAALEAQRRVDPDLWS